MGLYLIGCPTCGIVHMWFSGNLDQRCPDCRTVKTVNPDGTTTSTVKPIDPINDKAPVKGP